MKFTSNDTNSAIVTQMNPQQRWNSAPVDMQLLSLSLGFEFSKRHSPNRFLKGAMSERLSSYTLSGDGDEQGIPSPELANLYRIWGEGNIGVIITGNIMVDVEHMEAAGNAVIPLTSPFHGQRFEAFSNIASSGKRNGSLIIGQINHPGRQCEAKLQENPLSASDIQLEVRFPHLQFEDNMLNLLL
jgi:2,4-dienoyl-CoA reductase-like NADH-dependent reductase (Old Yellow Enzyme family)